VTLPNGLVTDYTYDAASRVTGLTYVNADVVCPENAELRCPLFTDVRGP
jgi:hypothetical protein